MMDRSLSEEEINMLLVVSAIENIVKELEDHISEVYLQKMMISKRNLRAAVVSV